MFALVMERYAVIQVSILLSPDGWKCRIYVLFLYFGRTLGSHLQNPCWKTLG